MKKALFSVFTTVILLFALSTNILAATESNIYKDSISVKVGSNVTVAFTYGDRSTSADIVLSNLKVDASIIGNNIYIKGLSEGISYVTLNFNDGTSDSIKVTVVSKTGSLKSDSDIEIEKGDYENLYIDLNTYDADKATIIYDSSIISVNKRTFTSSGNLKITGKNIGNSILKVKYDTGDVETFDIMVVRESGLSNTDMSLDIDEIGSYYIDLEYYDADKATITYDSYYVSVNKTTFTSSGNLKITGLRKGTTEIKVKYDTGDYEYFYVDVDSTTSNKDYMEEYELNIGETDSYYIDLDRYDADKATITYDDSIISLNKTTFTSSGNLKITGISRGSGYIKIKFDTGDIEYLDVEVYKNSIRYNEPEVSVDEIEIEKNEDFYFYVYLGDSNKATLSLSNNTYATISNSVIYSDSRIKVTGKNIGTTTLKVVFDDGTKINIPLYVSNINYKEPKAEIEEQKLYKNEKTTLSLYTGSENSTVTITLSNPEKIKLNVSNYSKNTNTYTIYSAKNKTVDIDITALDYINETDIIVKYPEGKTYKFILSVVDSKIEETNGYSKTGKHFKLLENISVDKDVLDTGYISGYTNGTFGPYNKITRAEFGTILARILNTNKNVDVFNYPVDITNSWAKESIIELISIGAISKNDLYRPSDYITRYEVAEMLYNILDLSEYSTVCPLSDIGNTVLDKKIAKCYNAGIIAGYTNGTFGGNNTITRSEAVVMMNRIFYSDMTTYKYNKFSDVSSDFWAYSYILKASRQ